MEEKKALPKINASDVVTTALKVPFVKIDREKFLRKELSLYYSEGRVEEAIEHNPACAGIPKTAVDRIARQIIKYETNKVSAISFAAGLPAGPAMAATIPADLAQYFGFMVRAMQKLAYLYGFDEFEFSEDDVNDATMNQMLIFLGVMFGVQEANTAVKLIADIAARQLPKRIAQKALTKGTIYPIVKRVVTSLGGRMTKQIFAESVGKLIPVAGGVISGGLSYVTFMPCCNRLKKSFQCLDICDPEFYVNEKIANSNDIYSDVKGCE